MHGFSREPIFASAVGDDDLGQSIRDRMIENDMCDAGLLTNAKPTGVVQVTFEDAEPSYQIVSERSYDFIEFQPEIVQQNEISLVYHGSLAWRNEVTRKAIQQYRNALPAIPVFVDLNIRQPWFDLAWLSDLVGGIAYLKLSMEELLHLSPRQNCDSEPTTRANQTPSEKFDSIVDSARRLLDEYSIQHLLVTDGGDGAYWITEDERLYQPSVVIDEVIDTIGAGDAFSSSAIHGVLAGIAPRKILENAAKFAAKVCSISGATTQDRFFYET